MELELDKITAFCAVLADTAQVSKACKAIGVSRTTAYAWRKQFLQFALAWDEALKVAVSGLEDEAVRRAHEGIDEPLIHQGQFTPVVDYDAIDPLTGEKCIPALAPIKRHADGSPVVATVKKFSDSLLTFLLKAHAPAKYGDEQGIELTGAGGGPIQFNELEKTARLAAILELAMQLRAGAADLIWLPARYSPTAELRPYSQGNSMKHAYQLTSNGNRHVARIAHKGHPIDIITGYDIVSDKWPFHIVIDGKKLDGHRSSADAMDEAIETGFDMAIKELDGGAGFQSQVPMTQRPY